jgi:hypothetical protein
MTDIIPFNETIQIRIEQDDDVESPANWDNVGQIAYCSSRTVLGTENVSRRGLDEICDGIEAGTLIGIPVYAYVHGGATIRAAESNPFSCPWDSGLSGFVYCTKEKAIEEFGKKVLTPRVKAQALKCLQAEVETFDQYLRGDIYGYIIERVGTKENLDSCWGIYGYDYCLEEAKLAAAQTAAIDAKETTEKRNWEERDVQTTA